jgi:hypothetical protein
MASQWENMLLPSPKSEPLLDSTRQLGGVVRRGSKNKEEVNCKSIVTYYRL